MKICVRRILAVAALALAVSGGTQLLPVMLGQGQGHAHAAETDGTLEIATGEGELVRLPRPAVSVFVANPDIADVQAPTGNSIFVLGKKGGTTTLYALDGRDREILRRTVVVRHNVAEMENLLRQRFPNNQLKVASAPGSLMVQGVVDNSDQVAAVGNTLAPYLSKDDKLINSVTLRKPTQVNLRVRIAEVSRAVTQQLGVNWQAMMKPGSVLGGIMNGRDFYDNDKGLWVLPDSGWGISAAYQNGGYNVAAVIDALDQEGLISVMAEPNLTAVSGQTASFLVGGEFPIPVVQSQSNAISVVFKPYGVALDFTPTVLAEDRISLVVRPEVSEISATNSVTVNNITVPGLSVRRVETTVELASGQSFAIGGLLQDNMRDVLARLPGLGDLPLLGKLFSSQDYRNNKTELVVIVTAYTVKPADGNRLQTSLQNLKPASDVEYITQQRTGIDPVAANAPRLLGAAGFIY